MHHHAQLNKNIFKGNEARKKRKLSPPKNEAYI
jgi:hypothetical protein